MPAGVSVDSSLRAPQWKVVTAALISCLSPLILLVFNRDWLLTPEGYLDPWNYVGMFHEYTNPDYAPGAYKLARLPWILSGWVVTHLLPTLAAAYTLHIVYFCAMTLALFAGVYSLFGKLTLAATVTLLLGFYTHAHGSGAWDYHNTAAGTFYLATFMMLARPSTLDGGRGALVITGVLAGLAVHANVTFVNFLPALAFIHLRTIQLRSGALPPLATIARRMGWTIVGLLLVTLLLCVVNWIVGREFLFFSVFFDLVARYAADSRYVAGWRHAPGWYLTAKHLALPAAVFVVGSAMLVWRRAQTSDEKLAASMVVQFLCMSLVWIGWQAAGQLALDWNYFAYVLIPGCFVAIAGILRPLWPPECERHSLAIIVGTAAALAIALASPLDTILSFEAAPPIAAVITVVGSVIFVAAFAAVFLLRPPFAAITVFVLLFAVDNRLAAIRKHREYDATDRCKTQPDIYLAIVDAASWLGRVDPSYTLVRTWFKQSESINVLAGCGVSLGALGGSITQMTFVPYIVNPYPMPDVEELPDSAITALANDEAILAIITNATGHLEQWDRRLKAMNLTHREIGRHRVGLLESGFTIYTWTIGPQLPDDIVFGKPVVSITSRTTPEINAYGTPKGTVAVEGEHLVFTPTDARDHLGYAMTAVPSASEGLWAEMKVVAPVANSHTCRVTVQDQQLTNLTSVACASSTKHFKIPAGAAKIRVTMQDTSRRPIVLPDRIEISTETQ